MSKSVERLTRKQLGAATLERSVTIVYGDFSSEIANKCYRELVRAQLPEKLVQARRGLDHLSTRESVLNRLQTGVMHHRPNIDAADAMVEVIRTARAKYRQLAPEFPANDVASAFPILPNWRI